MIQHVVLFHFPEDLSSEEEDALRAILRAWPQQMDFLRSIRLGRSIFDRWVEGYQFLMYLELDGPDALDRYMDAPGHLALGSWLRAHDVKVLVFNYELDANSVLLGGVADRYVVISSDKH